jgi:hypothetical protein
MEKATTALFVILLFVFSCTKESVSPDLDSGDNVLKKAEVAKLVTKTLKIHESSGTMGVVFCSCEDCGDFDDCEDCDSGMLYLIQGTGHATHMGAFTVQNTFCIGSGEPLRGILTAANGDQIFTMVTGPPVDGVYHYAILDGTGRFEGAKGYIDMWGEFTSTTFDLEGLGEITY